MADHSIFFKIGSVFKGEGFQKAAKTTKDLNASVKQSAEVAGQLGGVLGGLDTSSARAAGAMTGMISAVMSLNAVAIVSQAATVGMTLLFDKMKESVEGLTERMNAMKAKVQEAFASGLAERVNAVKGEVASLAGDFERVTKQANDFAAALNGLRGAQNQGGILALEVEKMNALLAAHGEAERQAIEQTYALKIATEKAAIAKEQGTLKIQAAEDALAANLERQRIASEQIALLEAERKNLEETMMVAKASNDENWVKIQSKVNELKAQEEALLTNRIALETEAQTLETKVQTAKQEALNMETQATLAVDAVRLKNNELAEKLEQRKNDEATAAVAAIDKAGADNRLSTQVKSAADIQAEVNAAAQALKNAQEAYAAKLREWNDPNNLAIYAARQSVGSGTDLKRGVLDARTQKTIQQIHANQKVSDAIASGAVTSVKEASRLEREAMREARDAISANQAQAIKEEQRYQRIQKMGDKAKSEQDKKFEKQYEQIKGKQDGSLAELGRAKDASDRAADALEEIKSKLEDLGLK
jgi:DNA repair exonuclease SbcCD ATPase subunit